MCLPEGDKRSFAGMVDTGDIVRINLDIIGRWTALGDGAGQTICPFPYQLPIQDDFESISQIQDRGSEHDHAQGILRAKRLRCVIP
jgi:hypothetical protein